jgi:hypothetical protein
VLRNYEQYALEKENTESGQRAAEYIRNFLDSEPLPSADDEYALHKKFLPGITWTRSTNSRRSGFPIAIGS